MPIDFEFKDSILWIRFSRTVAGDNLMDILTAVEKIESEQAVTPHRISDLSAVTEMHVGFDDVLALASGRRGKHFPNSFKSAIVACTEAQTGFARMFQTLNTNPQITIRIFPDVRSALAWIES